MTEEKNEGGLVCIQWESWQKGASCFCTFAHFALRPQKGMNCSFLCWISGRVLNVSFRSLFQLAWWEGIHKRRRKGPLVDQSEERGVDVSKRECQALLKRVGITSSWLHHEKEHLFWNRRKKKTKQQFFVHIFSLTLFLSNVLSKGLKSILFIKNTDSLKQLILYFYFC